MRTTRVSTCQSRPARKVRSTCTKGGRAAGAADPGRARVGRADAGELQVVVGEPVLVHAGDAPAGARDVDSVRLEVQREGHRLSIGHGTVEREFVDSRGELDPEHPVVGAKERGGGAVVDEDVRGSPVAHAAREGHGRRLARVDLETDPQHRALRSSIAMRGDAAQLGAQSGRRGQSRRELVEGRLVRHVGARRTRREGRRAREEQSDRRRRPAARKETLASTAPSGGAPR